MPKQEEAPGATRALILVSLAVLLGTSTWLSGTAVLPALREAWGLSEASGVWLTLATQLGFIVGTFLYALTNLADVFDARRVFFASAVGAAICNGAFAGLADGLGVGIALRFGTGVFLAGVYPVGMKIIASWFRTGLGWRLGVMVGALTVGTATPYLLRATAAALPWRAPVAVSSGLAVVGGLLVLFGVGRGPHLRTKAKFDVGMLAKVFSDRSFRYTAFGYFGHMWELYAFWSLISAFLLASFAEAPAWAARVPMLAFVTIAVGAIGCVGGGWLSTRLGERRVALGALAISGTACALSGFAFRAPPWLLVPFVLVWGVAVVADSAQFSALAARYCPPEYTGTALTVQNGVGFGVTLVSIQALPLLAGAITWQWALTALAVGPLVGAWCTSRLSEREPFGSESPGPESR